MDNMASTNPVLTVKHRCKDSGINTAMNSETMNLAGFLVVGSGHGSITM